VTLKAHKKHLILIFCGGANLTDINISQEKLTNRKYR